MLGQDSNPKVADSRKNALVILLAVLLVIVISMFIWQRKQQIEITKQLMAEKASIESELNVMVNNYDSLKRENSSLNVNIEGAQNQVKELLTEIEKVKGASYQQIAKYQNEMTTLRKIMRDYVIQIDSLNQKNQRLMAENSDVKQQVTEVKTINQQLEQDKKKLEQTVTLAAKLEAVNMTASGINKKGKTQTKAGKIENIKVDFTLAKNQTAKRGAKNIYMRIQRPDQLLLIKSDKDVFKFESSKIPFSAMREVEYEGMDLPVSIYWDNTGQEPFTSGVYTIDLFAGGENIGTTTLDIK